MASYSISIISIATLWKSRYDSTQLHWPLTFSHDPVFLLLPQMARKAIVMARQERVSHSVLWLWRHSISGSCCVAMLKGTYAASRLSLNITRRLFSFSGFHLRLDHIYTYYTHMEALSTVIFDKYYVMHRIFNTSSWYFFASFRLKLMKHVATLVVLSIIW